MKRNRRRRRQGGFTLMEVLLVMVILVVLAATAAPMVINYLGKANKDLARNQVNGLKTGVTTYYLHMNAYPPNLDALYQPPGNLTSSTDWNGPYFDQQIPLDPWKNPYQFAVPGKHNQQYFDVWSFGPDGQDGTDDDIGNWNIPNQ
jgi:general secretion pathway protein G